MDSPPPGEIGRGVQRYNSQALSSRGGHENDYGDDEESDMPPPLAEAGLRGAADAEARLTRRPVDCNDSVRGRTPQQALTPPRLFRLFAARAAAAGV